MKQELPFAVVLLAAGCLLWFWQSDTEKRPVFTIQSLETSATAMMARAGIDDPQTPPSRVASNEMQAVIPGPEEPDSKEILSNHSVVQPNADVQNAQANAYVHAETDRDAVQLMSRISKRLASSQPFGSKLQLTGDLFGQSVIAKGTYSQMGQGTYKSRIELKFGSEPNAPSVFQLCDGRFVYNLQTRITPNAIKGKKQTFEFVDLLRVQKTAGDRATGISPTGWVATGGISSLFQHLASAFNFGTAESTDASTLVLRGSWNPNSLRRVTLGQVDGDAQSPIRWEEVSGQLPHAVELSLKQNSDFLYFPNKITFLRFSIQKNGRYEPQPIVTLSLSEPQPLGNITDRFFVIDSSNLESIDATDRYISRIDAFSETRQAAEQLETLDR